MKIRRIIIEESAQEKILGHGLEIVEVENGMLFGNPKFLKDRYGRYLAITHHNRYITVVFEYINLDAHVITAYKSSDWQITLYKRK